MLTSAVSTSTGHLPHPLVSSDLQAHRAVSPSHPCPPPSPARGPERGRSQINASCSRHLLRASMGGAGPRRSGLEVRAKESTRESQTHRGAFQKMTVNYGDPKTNPDFRASSWEIPLLFESHPMHLPWNLAMVSQAADFLISKFMFYGIGLSPSRTICPFASLPMDPF